MPNHLLRQPNFAVFVLLAWLLLAAQLLAEYWAATGITLPDADDAMRLVQVREFLRGHGWFDLHEARLGLQAGYDTHWSRLIDAGLAGVFLLVRIFVDHAGAERLMAALWPVLWLLPCIAAAAAIAWRIAGRDAALIVLLLAIFAGPGIQQFRPGRIDHHNVQIALSVAAVAATVWADRWRFAAATAGALTGLVLAIGFEGLPLLVVAGATIAGRYVFAGESRVVREYGVALAATGIMALLITTPPWLWSQPVCDKIAINSASALAIVGLGLALLPAVAPAGGVLLRMAGVALIGAIAVVVFAALLPQCLGGHYALIDPAIRPIWLDKVSETKPLTDLIGRAPATGLATLAFPLVAVFAAIPLLRDPAARRDFGLLAGVAALAMSFVYMAVAMRGYSYAIWVGMPFIAAAAVRLFQRLQSMSIVLRFVLVIMVTPTAITLGVLTLASAAGQRELMQLNSAERAACTARANYAVLAALPRGRIAVNEIEWAPYLLAWTPHSVLAAPYHRLSPAILASHRILASPPAESRKLMAKDQVDYIVICGSHGAIGLSGPEQAASLWGRLQAGAVPNWLEPLPDMQPFAVYRVRS
jgi:hypothetical protein